MQFRNLFEMILPNIKNLKYQTSNLNGLFKLRLYFSIVVGLAPILLYITWILAPITNTKNRIFSGLIVIVFMIVAIVFRQMTIISTFNKLTNLKTETGETISNFFPMDNLHFEYYIFCGLLLSCILNFVMFKDKLIKSNT